jgi:hypothetical protein
VQLPLYPVVGIDSFSPVTFNFGAEPFAFDLTEVRVRVRVRGLGFRVQGLGLRLGLRLGLG